MSWFSQASECTSLQHWYEIVELDLLRWARREHCCPRCGRRAGSTPHDPTSSVPTADHKPQTRLSKTQITPPAHGSDQTFVLPAALRLCCVQGPPFEPSSFSPSNVLKQFPASVFDAVELQKVCFQICQIKV